MMPHKTDGFM